MSDFQQQSVSTSPPARTCWRCRKPVSVDAGRCPHCRARQAGGGSTGGPEPAVFVEREHREFRAVLIAFAMILATSVGLAVFQYITGDAATASEQTRMIRMGMLEVIDVLVILIACIYVRAWRSTDTVHHLRGFLLLVPMLALGLAINFGYHAVLNEFLGATGDAALRPSREMLIGWILLICIQPAIFEELFFRGVAFTAFQRVMGGHGTVLVTSVMFGVAHIYSPLSLPVLISLGVILGYIRLWSGSLVVPMLVHLIHNGVILSLQMQT